MGSLSLLQPYPLKNRFMFQEYEVVRLRRALEDAPVPPGTQGVVLLVYNDDPPAYEVEFLDADGASFGTFTVRENDLDLVETN